MLTAGADIENFSFFLQPVYWIYFYVSYLYFLGKTIVFIKKLQRKYPFLDLVTPENWFKKCISVCTFMILLSVTLCRPRVLEQQLLYLLYSNFVKPVLYLGQNTVGAGKLF